MNAIVEFGWLPEDYTYRGTSFTVAPLNNYDKVIECVRTAGRTISGWFYPPIVRDPKGQGNTVEGVDIHARGFTLPPSHRLEVAVRSTDAWMGSLILQVFGFTKGLRLLPDQWIHFYRAAVDMGKLTDFVCAPQAVEDVCERAHKLCRSLPDPRLVRSLFGLYHWYLFGQSYEHEFERFNAQYTVLDGCFSLVQKVSHKKTKVPHGQRAQTLCDKFGIPTPAWAVFDGSKNACTLSSLRNEFVHEGLYGGEPIGFAFPKGDLDNIELELTNLKARLLLAILGVKGDYVQSAVDTRQVFLLET